MQTFVPTGVDFTDTAQLLDYRRLGKQRVEAWQILNTITGQSAGWANHPAVKMWKGHETALALYGAAMCAEWVERGYNDSMLPRFLEVLGDLQNLKFIYPAWLHNEDIVMSHRSNLIRKFPEHYSPLWPEVPNNLPYIWPV